MANSKDRQDELLAIALGARRRGDSKTPRSAASGHGGRSSVPTPVDDQMSDLYKGMSPEQRELVRKFLEDMSELEKRR